MLPNKDEIAEHRADDAQRKADDPAAVEVFEAS